MEKITVNGKAFNVKTSLADVSLAEYNKYMSVFRKKYEYQFEQYCDLLLCISDMTVEDIEDLHIDKLKELAQTISIESFTEDDKSFYSRIEVEVNGTWYKSSSDGLTYNYTTKEMILLKDDISKKHIVDVEVLAAVVFKKLDADKNVIRDYSPKGVQVRAKELSSIPMSILAPYLLELGKYIKQETASNEPTA